jgi:predicted nucleic acid-binding protein
VIVADTNLIAYLLLPGPHTEQAARVRARDAAWVAPPLWRSELRNVLVLYVRQDRLDLSAAQSIFSDAAALLEDRSAEANAVLETATERSLTAYDAEFVALAQMLGLPLVTSDRRVLRACPGFAPSPDTFLDES